MSREDETVPVRVKDLKRLEKVLERGWSQVYYDAAKPLIDAIPKPRLVTVDLDELKGVWKKGALTNTTERRLRSLIQRLEKEA